MTVDKANEATGPAQDQGAKSRARKTARKSGTAAKRGRSTASRRSAAGNGSTPTKATRSRGSSRRKGASSSSAGIGARLLAGAGRAIPLATRSLPDQRMVQRLVDERPYMLGAIGLGIGAVIGLMLPGTLSSMTGHKGRGRSR